MSTTRTLRIAMNGVTGRMGYRQHLVRSILPLRDTGLVLDDGSRVAVEPILVGRNADKLAELAAEHDVVECVVGLPLSLSGAEGPAAVKVRAFAAELAAAVAPVGIRLFDERMTTMTADAMLRQAGRTGRGKAGRGKRQVIDQAAATVILQTALDTERSRGSAPGETL